VLGTSPSLSKAARRLAAAFGVGLSAVATIEEARAAGAAICDEAGAAAALNAAGFGAVHAPEGLAVDGELFARLWPAAAKISAFVVHRAEAPFDPMRLRSVFAQTHPVWEIVVLDEGEASLDVVDAEARAADRDVSLGLGIVDAWRRAAEMASGDFVWIVEGDGRADATALAALAAPLLAEPAAALAFGDSQPADEAGRPRYARPTLIDTAKRFPFFVDRTFDGAEILNRLADAPAPDISAILWRRDALQAALAASPDADLGGLLRAATAAPGARVHLVAEILNFVVAPGQGGADR